MKKLMVIFGATLLLASVATSCSKVCQCTVSYDVLGTTFSETINDIDLKGTTYKNCNAYGEALNSTYVAYSNVKVDCKKQ